MEISLNQTKTLVSMHVAENVYDELQEIFAVLALPISGGEIHDDVIKWKHFPRNWPFVRGIHRSRWIPHTKASDAELWCFIWSASE